MSVRDNLEKRLNDAQKRFTKEFYVLLPAFGRCQRCPRAWNILLLESFVQKRDQT